ncbi:hypothetical protein ACP70R_014657 [Stipagrostis hirtigluma subsp. patula]
MAASKGTSIACYWLVLLLQKNRLLLQSSPTSAAARAPPTHPRTSTPSVAMVASAAAAVSTRLRRCYRTHDAYTVRVAGRNVLATVTAHPAAARRWVHTTWWRHARRLRSGAGLTVGLGVQWTADLDGESSSSPAATLQLCAGHRCLVLHLARARAVPDALRRLLADPRRVCFVGYDVRSDCRRLLRGEHALAVAPGGGCHELRAVTGMGNESMERMAERLLGYPGIKKSGRVAMSDWDRRRLSEEQVEYACVDAVVACRLGERLGVADRR